MLPIRSVVVQGRRFASGGTGINFGPDPPPKTIHSIKAMYVGLILYVNLINVMLNL